jgi:hypothetical protein
MSVPPLDRNTSIESYLSNQSDPFSYHPRVHRTTSDEPPPVPQTVGAAPTSNKTKTPSFGRQQSINTIDSHDTDDWMAGDYDPFEDDHPPQIHVPRVKGYHPNRDRAEIMRNAQDDWQSMDNMKDIDSILNELEDCKKENIKLNQRLGQLKGGSKKQGRKKRGGKSRRRKVPLSIIFGTKLSKSKKLKKWKAMKKRRMKRRKTMKKRRRKRSSRRRR